MFPGIIEKSLITSVLKASVKARGKTVEQRRGGAPAGGQRCVKKMVISGLGTVSVRFSTVTLFTKTYSVQYCTL